jgi:lipopolysaccharide export system protein LptC
VKANEILIRQDRVVYILMVLLASVGLLWGFWQHQHPKDALVPTTTAAKSPAAKTIYIR